MKNAKPKLWYPYRDAPFEVMSVILFSALSLGSMGAAATRLSDSADKSQRVQSLLAHHAAADVQINPPTPSKRLS